MRTEGRLLRLEAAREWALVQRFHREQAAATGVEPTELEARATRFVSERRAEGLAGDALVAWAADRIGADVGRLAAVLADDERRFRAGASFAELAVAGPPAALRARLGIGEQPA